jgi:hypothetical protein
MTKKIVLNRGVLVGALLGLLLGVSVCAQAREEGKGKGPTPAAMNEPGVRFPVARPQAVAQARSGLRRVYVATESGLFVSDDGGRRWDKRGPLPVASADVLAMAVDPGDEQRLYAGGRGGLWRSPDGGVSWKVLSLPAPARSAIRSIAVAPTVPETIYVGADQDGIFRSADGGASWVAASRGLPEAFSGGRPAGVRSLAVHPEQALIAYAATELHGLYRTLDGGALWEPINQGLGRFPLRWRAGGPHLLLHSLDPTRLMALVIRPLHAHRVQTRLFQTSDGGEHWVPLEVELGADEGGLALADDPADPEVALLFTTTGAVRLRWQTIEGIAPSGKAR